MAEPQSYKNHARFDPPFHFFLAPLAGLNLVFAITYLVRHYPDHVHLAAWWIVMSIFAIAGLLKMRLYSLRVQDRIIRLEERIRFAVLLTPELAARAIATFKEEQYIALRFASDGELPALVERTLDQNLDAKQIKQAIVVWRPDHFRV